MNTKHILTLLVLAALAGGCASTAKKAGTAAVHTSVEGAKLSAKATMKGAKATGKAVGHAAAGAAQMLFDDDDATEPAEAQ